MVKDLCFEIIEKCPNNCKFCSSNSCITKNKIINLDDFKRVIDYFIKTGGIEELSLSGGEPFLHPDLFEMVRYAKGKGIRTVIFTSGVKYRDGLSAEEMAYYEDKMQKNILKVRKCEPWNKWLIKNIEHYYDNFLQPSKFSEITKTELKKLKSIGLDKIVFDYQGYEAAIDAYLMGRSENMRVALLDSLLNAVVVGLSVDVHFVPMKPNYLEILDILEMLEIVGIKNVSILNFVPQGRGYLNRESLELSDSERKEFFELLKKKDTVFSGNIRLGIPLQGEDSHKCNAGLEKLDIKYDGTILPCPAFKELTPEEYKKYGIKTYSIYENLEDVVIPGKGTRKVPLCAKVYQKKSQEASDNN